MTNTRLQLQFNRRKAPPVALVLLLLLSIASKPTIFKTPPVAAATAAVASAALHHSPRNNQKFRWSQSVDSATGVASSLETSSSSTFLRYTRDDDDDDDDDDASPFVVGTTKRRNVMDQSSRRRSHIRRRAAEIFASYPQYISWNSVSFGFCSTKRVANPNNNNGGSKKKNANNPRDDCFDIYNPFVGVTFLTFGPLSHTVQTKKISRRNGGIFSRFKKSLSSSCSTNLQLLEHTIFVTEIPILSGCLVNRRKLTNKSDRNESTYYGSLRFEFQQDVSTTDKDDLHQVTTGLKTQIIGYTPAIVGDAPVNPIRKVVYLSSQRLVHAYVMYRFHAYASSEMRRAIEL